MSDEPGAVLHPHVLDDVRREACVGLHPGCTAVAAHPVEVDMLRMALSHIRHRLSRPSALDFDFDRTAEPGFVAPQ